jgi:hypothetical protein
MVKAVVAFIIRKSLLRRAACGEAGVEQCVVAVSARSGDLDARQHGGGRLVCGQSLSAAEACSQAFATRRGWIGDRDPFPRPAPHVRAGPGRRCCTSSDHATRWRERR